MAPQVMQIPDLRRRLRPAIMSRADYEDVVQSAFKSFFARCERGLFDLRDWDGVWALLVMITLRKCSRRRVFLRARRRDARREVSWTEMSEKSSPWWTAIDREPTPEEAAVLAETVRGWLWSLEPAERRVMELGLQGYSTWEIAERLRRSERTVRRFRQRMEDRLEHSVGEQDRPA
jgi:RNA polymerase sigma-70 factor, ECF subfamily